MQRHVISLGLVLFCVTAAWGDPPGLSLSDWVDRMAAAVSRAPVAATAKTVPFGSEPEDWIARMIAGHGRELKPRSVLEIDAVRAALIAACAMQSMDGVLALFTRDATLVADGRTYVGIEQIQQYWARSAAFRPGSPVVGYSSGETIRVGADADRATLVFECVWLDAGTSKVVARSVAKHVLVKSGGAWTIAQMISAAPGST